MMDGLEPQHRACVPASPVGVAGAEGLTVRGIWREGENAPTPPRPPTGGTACAQGTWWKRLLLGERAGWRGPRMRRLPSRGEKRGGVVGAAVLAAVGEGAAAGFLVLRTDAIGAPGKVRIQP